MICASVYTCVKKGEQTKLQSGVLLLNFSTSFFIVIVLLYEIFFSSFPQLLPSVVVNVDPSILYSKREKTRMLEYLEENPWVKFRANTAIRSLGDRGKDFINAWITDDLGYKNYPYLSHEKHAVALLLGDSFAEGMGSPIDGTWASQLTKTGFPVYNLGVQGYAPIQMAGTLKSFGTNFDADYVFFGYTPGFEKRESQFVDIQTAKKNKVFTGGIESINNYMHEERTLHHWFKVTNATISMFKARLKYKMHFLANTKSVTLQNKSIFNIYRDETLMASDASFDPKTIEFQLTLKSILEVKKMASQQNSKMVLIVFPQRTLVYYEKTLGQPPPSSHYELALIRQLLEFCKQNAIEIIVLHSTFKDYADHLPINPPMTDLPYLEFDAHFSHKGNQMVANEIKKYLCREMPEKCKSKS
ncbi:MAG: hypothetical protein A3G33_03185 [Omnitrophica bacterium RIFCSPLOWO2_12_FULL_44_17]|uniref:Uncharacterized protein n=1 Tax=Candidatus Danuiimicrobium aquiferis TaxID=1801832 RepID=A0A1G1KTN6_9BACT|nr:MAG: hypothetical protein A3B72_06730 [Omnitrophica bacterium RIFCSPHIGHO2_02_FULL_45_28]OGW92208.1 MAG: hypothetical protein A3E74_03930 [Omnitrophica bacterium RIFCSPHIGHO2_12_FULL_44_12]OGW96323.1 MAG: hypothetical protein A3G33_03185 [Omnitrophica bacterium RIFCSPLOWO2_12_FULL_44_17]OGX04245.1 MAG: hypothetical protein A3J12_10850 [Omnitrophica bacterium RIFCSPLOWO2_02_FULL_44_11]